jgi:hypothetical protein
MYVGGSVTSNNEIAELEEPSPTDLFRVTGGNEPLVEMEKGLSKVSVD